MTPVREEAGHLGDLAATIRAQELRPRLWVIVDDGSSDDTADRLRRLTARDPWIHGVSLPRVDGSGRPSAMLLTVGFRHAAEQAEAEGLRPRYFVNVDPDLRCPPHLMAELIERSDRDRGVGICSCAVAEVADDGRVHRHRDVVDGIPRADLRVWRSDCVHEVGMVPGPRWAQITGVRARNRGWRTPVFDDLVVEAAPAGALKDGWTSLRRHGAEGWEVGVHPLVMATEAVSASVHDRDLRGVAMAMGYVGAAVSGKRRSRDPELREYFGEDLLREQARTLLSRVPLVGRRFRRRS